MGMNFNEVAGVTRVTIETAEKKIVIEEPSVVTVTMQGQTMYQVAGGTMKEVPVKEPVKTVVPEADVKLVSEQTGKTAEEAKKALEQTGGDLAKAILLLKTGAT
jgi:nascent polypeptide-associated complex subunit alpha